MFSRPLEPDAYVPGAGSVWLGDLGGSRQGVLVAEYAGVERWHFVPGKTVRTAGW